MGHAVYAEPILPTMRISYNNYKRIFIGGNLLDDLTSYPCMLVSYICEILSPTLLHYFLCTSVMPYKDAEYVYA